MDTLKFTQNHTTLVAKYNETFKCYLYCYFKNGEKCHTLSDDTHALHSKLIDALPSTASIGVGFLQGDALSQFVLSDEKEIITYTWWKDIKEEPAFPFSKGRIFSLYVRASQGDSYQDIYKQKKQTALFFDTEKSATRFIAAHNFFKNPGRLS